MIEQRKNNPKWRRTISENGNIGYALNNPLPAGITKADFKTVEEAKIEGDIACQVEMLTDEVIAEAESEIFDEAYDTVMSNGHDQEDDYTTYEPTVSGDIITVPWDILGVDEDGTTTRYEGKYSFHVGDYPGIGNQLSGEQDAKIWEMTEGAEIRERGQAQNYRIEDGYLIADMTATITATPDTE